MIGTIDTITVAMIGTVDISSDIKWHEQELWILYGQQLAMTCALEFCWPIVAITGILDTNTVFLWQ